MQKLILAIFLLATAARGQYTPPPSAAYVYSAGSWAAASSSTSSGAINYAPPPIALYCWNSSLNKWVPADSSCFGGSGVTSLNSLTGALSLTSIGSTVTITPSGTSINLETVSTGTVAAGTATYFGYYATSGTTIGPDLNWLDNGTDLVAALPVLAPSFAATGSGAGAFTATAGTAPTGAAGKAIYSTDATVGYAEVNENNTGLSRVCTAANGQCSGGTVNTGTATYFSYYATTGTTIGPDLNWLDNGTDLVAAEPISAPSISATTQLTVGGGTAGSPTQISNTATPISALPAASTLAPSTVGSNTQYYYRWILDGTTANDCTAGGGANLHWCYSNGTSWIVSSSSYILPAQYTITPCSVTLTNNGSAISSATYSVVFNGSCLNDFGATYTIAHASVYSDNGSGSSTCSATDNSSNAVLSASTAANASWLNNADSNISGTHFTIASGAWLNFSIFADGTSKTIKCVLTTTR